MEKAAETNKALMIAPPNWAEIRYMVERKTGRAKWLEVRDKLLGLPIQVIEAGKGLAEAAGEVKAAHKMSLADCFAAALAKEKKAELYTGNPEFKSVEKEIHIVWI